MEARIREILSNAEIDGHQVRLPRLDPKTYKECDAALQSLGGTWNKKEKAHVFGCDPRLAIEEAVEGVDRKPIAFDPRERAILVAALRGDAGEGGIPGGIVTPEEIGRLIRRISSSH